MFENELMARGESIMKWEEEAASTGIRHSARRDGGRGGTASNPPAWPRQVFQPFLVLILGSSEGTGRRGLVVKPSKKNILFGGRDRIII